MMPYVMVSCKHELSPSGYVEVQADSATVPSHRMWSPLWTLALLWKCGMCAFLPPCRPKMWLPNVKLLFPNASQVDESRWSVNVQIVKHKNMKARVVALLQCPVQCPV